MHPGLQKVADVIISNAVLAFNEQFNGNYDWKQFSIYSLPPNTSDKCGYEIVGNFPGEELILHIYSEIGRDYWVGRYELRDEVNNLPGITEKRYVALARFDDSILYLNNNFIRRSCPAFDPSDSRYACIMEELFIHGLMSELGQYLLDETA